MLIKLNRSGALTLPKDVREGLAGTELFEVARRDDGVIELRLQADVDPDQAWFWSERWQQMEREADADIAAGRVQSFDSFESFDAFLASAVAR